MKKLLMMALAAATILSSCSKQDDINNGPSSGKVSLSVNLDMSKFTRSNDAEISTIPVWDNLLLVVFDNEGTYVTQKTLTKEQYDALTTAKTVNLIEKTANALLDGGKVKAYITTTGNTWGTLSADPAGTVNLPTLAAGQLDINNWQRDGFITGTTAGTFANVPYYGEATIAKNGVAPDSHILLQANVSVTPELGRVQVVKTPLSEGEKNGYTVKTLL